VKLSTALIVFLDLAGRKTSEGQIRFCEKVLAGLSGCAVWGVGLDRSDTGIVGSNPAQGMDVCPRLSVLCCPV
jgi:hypothetical protein